MFCGAIASAQDMEVPGVPEIKAAFYAINANLGLKKRVLENEEFLDNITDGGGTLTFYSKKDTVVKIVELIGLSFGNTTREFYFNNGKLIFIYGKVCNFVQKDGGDLDYKKTHTTFEGRYYIKDNKTIKVVINQEEPGNEMGKELMDNMFVDGDRYLKMFNQKK